jgi:hypothetical protein
LIFGPNPDGPDWVASARSPNGSARSDSRGTMRARVRNTPTAPCPRPHPSRSARPSPGKGRTGCASSSVSLRARADNVPGLPGSGGIAGGEGPVEPAAGAAGRQAGGEKLVASKTRRELRTAVVSSWTQASRTSNLRACACPLSGLFGLRFPLHPQPCGSAPCGVACVPWDRHLFF